MTAKWLTKVREEAERSGVGIDYNHRLSIAETASFATNADGHADFIEEPIRDETPEAYEALVS